jgi:O-antigen ligase
MLYVLAPVLFLSVGWFAHEPVGLLSSSVLILWILSVIVLTKQFNWRQSKLYLAPLLMPVGYLVSAVINAQPAASVLLGGYQRNFGLATLIALALLFVLLTDTGIDIKKHIDFGFLTVLLVANLYGYLQYFDVDPLPWTNPYKSVALTLGNPNFAGALFGMLAVLAFARAVYSKTIIIRVGYLILLISTIFLGFQSKSLQAQLLVVVSILVFLFTNSIGKSTALFRVIRYTSLSAFLLASAAVISIFGFSGFSQFKDRVFFQGSIPQRLDYWRTGLNIWQDNVLFGVGADQFQRYAALYRTPEQIIRDGNMVIPDKSHNVFIDHLANGGVVAGCLWLIMVLSVFYVLFKILRSKVENQVEISILAGIWTAYVVQSLISPDQLVLSVIGYSSAGLIVSRYLKLRVTSTGVRVKKENPFFIRAICGLAVAMGLVIYGMALNANKDAKDMLDGKLVGADSYIKVLDAWPNSKVIELIGIELVKDPNNCQLTNTVADKLIKIDDRSSQGWFMKAVCANASRDFLTAIGYVENSLKFDPFNPYYLISKAKLEIAANQLDQAAQTVAKVKAIKPSEPEIGALESSIAVLQKETD